MAVKKKYDRNVLGRGLDNIGSGKGRGLDALIDTSDVHVQGSSNLSEIALTMISPNPNQPRTDFDDIRSLPVSVVGERPHWQASPPSPPISVRRKTRR